MDTNQVVSVARLVANKYGKPNAQSGNPSLGEVSYTWRSPDGVQIKVYRGWPDTTTFLLFTDPDNYRALQAEMAAVRQANEQAKAKAQSKAF